MIFKFPDATTRDDFMNIVQVERPSLVPLLKSSPLLPHVRASGLSKDDQEWIASRTYGLAKPYTGKDMQPMAIEDAAKMLGRKLCGRVPHVVGVSILKIDQSHFELRVNVDAPAALNSKDIPKKQFKGFKVHRKLTGTPKFASHSIASPPAPTLH